MQYLKFKSVTSLFALLLVVLSVSFSYNAMADDKDNPDNINDPLEKANRVIFGFNDILDKAIMKPIAKGYRFIVPSLAREGVHNVLNNLSEPVTIINSALQGDKQNSFASFWRFVINSTYGIGGLFDVAKDAGLYNKKQDFGITAGVYGVGQGPYIVLPLLGPSNARDTVGKVADAFGDPFNYVFDENVLIVETAFSAIDKREDVLDLTDHIEKTSLDPYATLRSLYTQRRIYEVNNSKTK